MKRLFVVLFILSMCGQAFSAQFKSTFPATSDNLTSFPTDNKAQNDAIINLTSKYRRGLSLYYKDAATITVTAGEVMVTDATSYITLANAASTDVTFANIDTGSEAAGTTYYVYAVAASTASTSATFVISLSSTAPTGSTYYKRLGNFYNDGSSNITLVTNDDAVSLTGTVANGGTISLPTGYVQGMCSWMVSTNSPTGSAGTSDGIRDMQITAQASTSRVVTCKRTRIYSSTSEDIADTCNYLITCKQ